MQRFPCAPAWVLPLALGVALSLAVLLSPGAQAEHEPGHRFVITGRVTDSTGAPVCGVPVRAADVTVVSTSDTNRTGATDSAGNYRIQLHLHSSDIEPVNNNEGDTLLVTVVGHGLSRTLTATRSPSAEAWGNAVVELRIPHRVASDCGSPLLNVLPFVAVPLVVGALAFVAYRRVRFRLPAKRDSLRRIPGVGRAKAARLREAGYATVDDLADARAKDIAAKTSLPPKEAKRLIRKAKEIRAGREAQAAEGSD